MEKERKKKGGKGADIIEIKKKSFVVVADDRRADVKKLKNTNKML